LFEAVYVAFFLAIPHRLIHDAKTFSNLGKSIVVANFYDVNLSGFVTRELLEQLRRLIDSRLVDRSDGIPARR